jgi:hypothetical protein
LMGGGKAGSGEHGSAESEGESEDGVLPLNHFESDAEIVKDGHGTIVEQGRVVVVSRRRLVGEKWRRYWRCK